MAVEDYFNYWIPGLVWLLDITAIALLVSNPNFGRTIKDSFPKEESFGSIPESLLIAAVLILPYLVGIVLAGFGNLIHGLDKLLLGKPEDYVLNGNVTWIRQLLRWVARPSLGAQLRDRVNDSIQNTFASDKSKAVPKPGGVFNPLGDSRFGVVERSLDFAGNSAVVYKRDRLRNLQNLNEGLIPPLLTGTGIAYSAGFRGAGTILLVIVISTWSRYHLLREDLTKHVFRAFWLSVFFGKLKRKEEQTKEDHRPSEECASSSSSIPPSGSRS